MADEINIEELDETLIYHEKQASALCGRHALNNLLQGPYLDEFQLAEIAHELDSREREIMLAEGSETADALRYLAEASGNVDDSGNFSITVLKEALARGHGLSLIADNEVLVDALENPNKHAAYILNLRQHWFCIRRLETILGPKWFNLNSLLKIPEIIGDFYLSAYLAEMRAEGYCLFVVQGDLPACLNDTSSGPSNSWHTVGSIIQAVKAGKTSSKVKADERKAAAERASREAMSDAAYAAALRASMAETEHRDPFAASNDESEEEMLHRALQESLKEPAKPRGETHGEVIIVENDDDDIAAAIALSLADAK